jgi:hypothetical protein
MFLENLNKPIHLFGENQMTHSLKGLGLAGALTLVSTLGLNAQASAQSPAAYVYVQASGPAGPVYGYSASSSGQMSSISGSPFKLGTMIIGSNGSQFFTMGHTTLRSWAVGSNGSIGLQLSDLAFTNFDSGSCAGTKDGDATGVLDHTGKYIYVVLQNYEKTQTSDTCQTYQSYLLGSGGQFTFDGQTEYNSLENASAGLPSILGNESFAYANYSVFGTNNFLTFQRNPSGTLSNISVSETDPTLTGGQYNAYYPDADPAGSFLAVQLYPNNNTKTPPQLASYTVDSQGNISSTNTESDMPTSALINPRSTFSPDGKMIAFYADNGASNVASGIEIYNFNGAAPLTLYQKVLTGTPIEQVAWDTSGHLYAISKVENHMYVFNVSSSSVTVDPSVAITAPVSLVVVSKSSSTRGGGSCSAPSSPGVNVCSPAEEATVSSPVQINATANVSGGVYRFELWNGGTKLASVSNSGTMNQTVSLAAGTYHLTFSAYNTSGTHEYATRDITVK